MELIKYSFTKQVLCQLEENERDFFIRASAMVFELTTSIKLLKISFQSEEHGVENTAQNTLSSFLLIQLAGKICECWNTIRKEYFGSGLSKKYNEIFNDSLRDMIKKTKKYFGGKNLIEEIRNKMAFHFDRESISNKFNKYQDSDSFNLFFSNKDPGFDFFEMPCIILIDTLIEWTEEKDGMAAVLAAANEVFNRTKETIIFLKNYLKECLDQLEDIKYEKVIIGNPPIVNDLKIPFFINIL